MGHGREPEKTLRICRFSRRVTLVSIHSCLLSSLYYFVYFPFGMRYCLETLILNLEILNITKARQRRAREAPVRVTTWKPSAFIFVFSSMLH